MRTRARATEAQREDSEIQTRFEIPSNKVTLAALVGVFL